MANSIFSDDAFRSAKIALDGLALRQQMIGRNLSNVDTPGYRAQTVNFESTLQQAMQQGTGLQMETTNAAHLTSQANQPLFLASMRTGGSTRADGNNVDVDVEMTEMSADTIRYQALTESVSTKLGILKYLAR